MQNSNIIPVLVAAGGRSIGIQPLLDVLVELAPSPAELPAVKAHTPKGEIELTYQDAGPLAAYVWKTTADPFVGRQTYFKVYSGVVSSDTRVWNANKGEEERLAGVQVPFGKDMLPVSVIHSGDIGAVAKLSVTTTGDTLTTKEQNIILPVPSYPHPLYRVAINPKTQSDAAKMSQTLTRMTEEDMTLSWEMEAATHQTLLFGMGDQHIDVALKRMEQKFQLNLVTLEPKVPYEEHITREGSATYRHKKQTGGSGQFGEVSLKVFPIEGEDFTFSNDVFGGAISNNYMGPIEKGIRNVMKEGVVAGYPVHNVSVPLLMERNTLSTPNQSLLKLPVAKPSRLLSKKLIQSSTNRSCASPSLFPKPTWATSWATSTPGVPACRVWTPSMANPPSMPSCRFRK